MATDTFDADLQALGMLALCKETVDEFIDHYTKMLEDVATAMLAPANADKLAGGLITRRGEQLKAMLHEEVRFLGGEPPTTSQKDNENHCQRAS